MPRLPQQWGSQNNGVGFWKDRKGVIVDIFPQNVMNCLIVVARMAVQVEQNRQIIFGGKERGISEKCSQRFIVVVNV